ncbi:hypothetical protein FOPG_08773 [Fusarium oxysporum f. sp. conglutinans race 2 54008]|uniref:WW domain-containing protein n=1 Tax=Fusarium oxysporum f. sp. conglutinans race 2 54008 TaxID=1089457 RepID=X0HXU2_FUSOX|nr:hypothetical protein FOPG_08773 [Fusarium oxysporum f. sp. conglutinans race 2 54008]
MARYQYSSLDTKADEIRLIKLMPGLPGQKITFKIFHTSVVHGPIAKPKPDPRMEVEELEKTVTKEWIVKETLEGRYLFLHLKEPKNSWDHPDPGVDPSLYCLPKNEEVISTQQEYDALSYVWGSTNEKIEVQIQTESDRSCTLMIGANLADALEHLRYPDKARTIWIDAICINQDDIQERNSQVPQMRSIYSLAKSVLVWLGPDADGSGHALHTLVYFAAQVEFSIDETYGDAPKAQEKTWWDPRVPLPWNKETWASITALFQRPYFRRVWVLQEVMLASNAIVQCGYDTAPWTSVRKAMLVLVEKPALEPELFEFLNRYRSGILAEVARNVPRILLWARSRQCTDPRDRVYGLLGLMCPSIPKLIGPNYDEPLCHTYRKMALAHIQITQRLSILRCCELDNNANRNWPSWVPDWTVAQNSLFGFRKGHSRQPSGHTASQARYIDANILEVVGIECASLSAVRYVSSATEMFGALSSWTPGDLRLKSYPGGGSLFDAFWEAVTKGRVHDRYVRNTYYPTVADLRIRCQAAVAGEDSFDKIFHLFKEELDTERTWLTLTYEGYLGVVMSEPQQDDRVFILLGSDVPLLLRPTGEGKFLVVGQCFVPGLMDAEAILGPLPQGWTIQMRHSYNGREATWFINTLSGLETIEDPRLPILPPDWEVIHRRSGPDDPDFLRNFRNNVTGEVINHDPRVLPMLKSRDIPLRKIQLI